MSLTGRPALASLRMASARTINGAGVLPFHVGSGTRVMRDMIGESPSAAEGFNILQEVYLEGSTVGVGGLFTCSSSRAFSCISCTSFVQERVVPLRAYGIIYTL